MFLLSVLFASAASPTFAPAPTVLTAPADLLAPPADAVKTPSGLVYRVLVPGSGSERATPEDRVVVNYTGWTADGTAFDSTKNRGTTAEFQLKQLIPGWIEGIGLMAPGSTVRMWIPVNLAYKFAPGAPMGNLVFDVELVRIIKAPTPVQVPLDVAAPPATASTTPSGLAWRTLTPGTGTVHPGPTATVEVSYAGWTPSGKALFAGGAQRTTLDLATSIPGLSEGVQRMVVGEKARFWLPAALVSRSATAGLTFDVELISITPTK